MKQFSVLIFVSIFLCAFGMPYEELPTMLVRSARSPHRAMMFSGYYGSPMDAMPGMTAFTAGSAGPINPGCGDCDTSLGNDDDDERPVPVAPTKGVKNNRQHWPAEAEDNEGNWPLRMPSYTSFFPMMFSFGGLPGAGRRSATKSGNNQEDNDPGAGFTEGGFPGGANTAIANSFSTGRSGQATSYAVSMGADPAAMQRWYRSQQQNGRQH